MKIVSVAMSLMVASLVGCGGPEVPAQDPSTTAQPATTSLPAEPAASASTPAAAEAPKAVEAPKAPEAPPVAVLSKPASAWQADGKSLSTIPADELREAFVKAGWKVVDGSPSYAVRGQYEAFYFEVENGKKKALVRLARPTQKPEVAKGEVKPMDLVVAGKANNSMMDELDQKAAAVTQDEASAVIVAFALQGGKQADAKKALAGVVKEAKK